MLTHAERLAKALEFNKRFVASGYTSKKVAEEIILSEDLTHEQLESLTILYDEWKEGVSYKTGKHVRYDGRLYRVLAPGHTSQSDWTPNIAESLFTVVRPQGVIELWGERNLTTNPFMIGEQVKFEGVIYESTINDNVWSPTGYPQGWKTV